ncbi:MAG: peptide chain release factor N(5)-glutamine methyltransferase [Ruminococcus sp.]|nr:peptide chain release factor N(5)-glutamine methyltransferase [Ruminococcus sp.]
MTRKELFDECVNALAEQDIPDSHFDVMCIFEDVLAERWALSDGRKELSPEKETEIRRMVSLRLEGQPLQYILGQWEFWSLPLKVGEGVLIPRPDTETLVEDVLRICRERRLVSPKIADLCSGSGCIALALKKELPEAEIYALELSGAALGYLRQNAALNSADIKIICGDVLAPETAELLPELDIVVSNPPYLTAEEMNELQKEVRCEPESALYGGADGLDFYRAMTPIWKKKLGKGGFLCYEFGMGQHDTIGRIIAGNGFENLNFSRDGGGIIRTVTAEKTED